MAFDLYVEVELDERANRLARERNISLLEAKLISNLLSPELEEVYFNEGELNYPKSEEIPNLREVSHFLASSILNGKKILIHGDYDTDGIMGTTILYSGLNHLGGNVSTFIPSRFEDGYGLSEKSVEEAKSQNAEIVLTVDCGTNSDEVKEKLLENGITLIVTDHHIPEDRTLKDNFTVNPHYGEIEEYKSFCGATVGYIVLREVAKILNKELREEPFIRLCGIATISDCVPITPFNFLLCKKSLRELENSPSYGLKALLSKCPKPPYRSYHISYHLSPRLNSAGRIEDSQIVLNILLEKDRERAEELVLNLEEINEQRKRIQNLMAEQIDSHFVDCGSPFIFFASDRFHIGLIGPVASRISYEKNKSVILVAVDGENATGSARSTEDVDITSLLRECSGIFTRLGGHERASGFSLPTKKVNLLKQFLEERFKTIERSKRREKKYLLLEPSQIDEVWSILGKLDPIDHSKEPLFFGIRAKEIGEPRSIMDKHIAWNIPNGKGNSISAFFFGGFEKLKEMPTKDRIILGKLVPDRAKQKQDFFFEVVDVI